ncbi:MAG TPA: universal stress protein [Chitinophagaceae bacterium]|nr:universal stress protein [Chitinophagaceae bacterium]HUM64495.1 universal stress protein [Chitinophagaceae bacterium]
MRTIIVPTDFSPNALYAASYAADLANLIGAVLELAHVYDLPVAVSEIPVSYPVEDIEAEIQSQLNNLKEKLSIRTAGRIPIKTTIMRGDVIAEINKHCESVQPYAIVIGAESAGPMKRLMFGGRTINATKTLMWPLIIVPPYTLFRNIRKIGLACDFRDVIETVRVQEIKDIVKEFKADLHILHISDGENDSIDPKTVEESALLEEMLGDLNPIYHFLHEPDIDKGIRDYVHKNRLDLLIIIPKKHGLIDKIFHHSHSKDLVLHAPLPILSLHE